MAKPRIIVKKRLDWSFAHPLMWFCAFIISIAYGILFLMCSWIPLLNVYILDNVVQMGTDKKRIFKEVKYRLVRQEKIIKEVLEKV